MKFDVMSATGNVFAVYDGLRASLPQQPGALAQALCRGALAASRRLDGLLVVAPPRATGACRMMVFNADGSRAEACGNGLRCVARWMREAGGLARDRFSVETDAGTRAITLQREDGLLTGARVSMGVPRVVERNASLNTSWGELNVTKIDMGNPHCVVVVADERPAPVVSLGAEVEHHRAFPQGTNVEFVAHRGGEWYMRVWERGVGETGACGSGACATALAMALEGSARFPIPIHMPGGTVEVHWEGHGEMHLAGPCKFIARSEALPITDSNALRSVP